MMSPEMYFARHVKIQDPFVLDIHDVVSPAHGVNAHIVAMIKDAHEMCIEKAIIDEAKRMGVTDAYVLDRGFVRQAISNAVPQNTFEGCCPKCLERLSDDMSYCPRCGQMIKRG